MSVVNKIKALSQADVLKIAAGEVIVRPASVVKELLENSIDAGAKNIHINIIDAGKTLISVKDDGCGMNESDCKNSVLIHWTSKIEAFSDLHKISSLGFRGEALASISAISDLTIKTRQAESNDAVEVEFSGQNVISSKAVPGLIGTTISVKNLFKNVPARLKFLKQNKTEESQILQLVQAIAAINFTVGITLTIDSRTILDLPIVSSKKERIVQLMGLDVSDRLVEVSLNAEQGGVKISGFVSKPTLTRYSRNYISLAANSRPIRDVKITNAIIAGYSRMLDFGKYPLAFLSIDVPGELIDFNVHPCKEEVHFQNYSSLCKQVKESVAKALGLTTGFFGVSPELGMSFSSDEVYSEFALPKLDWSESVCGSSIEPLKFDPKPEVPIDFAKKVSFEPAKKFVVEQEPLLKVSEPNKVVLQEETQMELSFVKTQKEDFVQKKLYQSQSAQLEGEVVAQLFETVIVVRAENYVLMIDQHAAHERILYQRALDGNGGLLKNRLLCPEIFTFSSKELESLMAAQHAFSVCGFVIEPLGVDKIVLKASPVGLGLNFVSGIFKEFLNFISGNEMDMENLEESVKFFLYSQISCKSAVKAGDVLSLVQMETIYRDLMSCNNNAQCIHGRPTMWKVSRDEVLRQFKRNGKLGLSK